MYKRAVVAGGGCELRSPGGGDWSCGGAETALRRPVTPLTGSTLRTSSDSLLTLATGDIGGTSSAGILMGLLPFKWPLQTACAATSERRVIEFTTNCWQNVSTARSGAETGADWRAGYASCPAASSGSVCWAPGDGLVRQCGLLTGVIWRPAMSAHVLTIRAPGSGFPVRAGFGTLRRLPVACVWQL